jgi:hypothetical protein
MSVEEREHPFYVATDGRCREKVTMMVEYVQDEISVFEL